MSKIGVPNDDNDGKEEKKKKGEEELQSILPHETHNQPIKQRNNK